MNDAEVWNHLTSKRSPPMPDLTKERRDELRAWGNESETLYLWFKRAELLALVDALDEAKTTSWLAPERLLAEINAAVQAETERCAMIADSKRIDIANRAGEYDDGWSDAGADIAAAIRAPRGPANG